MENCHNCALFLLKELENTKKANKNRESKFNSSHLSHLSQLSDSSSCFSLHPNSSFTIKKKSIVISGPEINQNRKENISIINFINEKNEYVCVSISSHK
jgi:hypothetical protein